MVSNNTAKKGHKSIDLLETGTTHAESAATCAQPEYNALVDPTTLSNQVVSNNTANKGRESIDRLTLLKVSVLRMFAKYLFT